MICVVGSGIIILEEIRLEDEMEEERINLKMDELATLIEYPVEKHDLLATAMRAIRTGTSNDELSNERLALVGDKVLALVVVDCFYKKDYSKGVIDAIRQRLDNNRLQYRLICDLNIIDFAYNDKHFYTDEQPDHERVSNRAHTGYLEAIIGAIYYDAGYELTRQWILNWLMPKLKEIADK